MGLVRREMGRGVVGGGQFSKIGVSILVMLCCLKFSEAILKTWLEKSELGSGAELGASGSEIADAQRVQRGWLLGP